MHQQRGQRQQQRRRAPQAAQRLQDASRILSQEPAALQLRYLQTLTEIATERNSTILFPLPMDLIKPLLERK